jgi:putative pyruvate formate lyase activating enzyme
MPYCQNRQISRAPITRRTKQQELASLHLQDDALSQHKPCITIALVPQIIDALCYAIPGGLHIPLIYNTNGYDALDTLEMLDGIIDVYLPDIKYSSDLYADSFSNCSNYVKLSRQAIKEMYRQAGNLATDESGIAQRGLIVRHLILPNGVAGSADSISWLANNISREVTVNMAQYYPCYLASQQPLISRKISLQEYNCVTETVNELGLENGWLQEMDSSDFYLPDFKRQGHPFSMQRTGSYIYLRLLLKIALLMLPPTCHISFIRVYTSG